MDITSLIGRLLIAVMTIGVAIWLAVLLIRSRARATRNPGLEARYGAAGHVVKHSPFGSPVVSGSVHDVPFVMTATQGVHTTPAMTVIRVPDAPGATFAIRREASRDLSGRDLVEAMFPEPKVREAVRALFGAGFDTIMRTEGQLSATRTFKAELLHPEALDAAIAHLAVIRSATDVLAAPSWLAPPPGSTRLAVASMVLMVGGVLLFALGLSHGGAALGNAWPGIVAAYFALAALAAFFLRGRPLAGGETACVVFMGLPGLILGGCGIAMIAG